MLDLLRQAMYGAFVLFIISTVWALGWARSIEDQLQERWHPTDPGVFGYANDADRPRSSAATYTPADAEAQQILTSTREPDDL